MSPVDLSGHVALVTGGNGGIGFGMADALAAHGADVAINHNPGDHGPSDRADASYLRNDIGSTRGWLAVELRGTESNRDAVGATVEIESGELKQLRQVNAGSAYASQHGQRLYFGLGEHPRVDRLTVRWPSGRVEEFEDLAVRQLVRIVEGGDLATLALRPAAPHSPEEAAVARLEGEQARSEHTEDGGEADFREGR